MDKAYTLMRFACPHCGKKIGTRLENQGRRARCSKCEGKFRIPTLDVDRAKVEILSETDFAQCPECKAHLKLTERQRRKPTVRCGRCRAEFLNMFADQGAALADTRIVPAVDEPTPRPAPRITLDRETIDARKGVFGKAAPPPAPEAKVE